MFTSRGQIPKLLTLTAIAVFQSVAVEPALASESACSNEFCWTACSSVQGAWCGTGCDYMVMCGPAGICAPYGLVTVNCYGAS